MTHEERVYHHLYETLEGIAEQSERIASLEELVCDLWLQMLNAYDPKEVDDFAERMRALGLDPEGEQ